MEIGVIVSSVFFLFIFFFVFIWGDLKVGINKVWFKI